MKIWIVLLSIRTLYAIPTLENTSSVGNPISNQTNLTLQNVQIEEIFAKNLKKTDNGDNEFPTTFTPNAFLALLIGIYCFTFLAMICDGYFLPCIERICETLNLSQDVAAATFMAMATSTPEFFVNIIGTFLLDSDIGVGTVIGSSLFNTLGVTALGSLAASKPIQVDWWPVTRDCTIYMLSVTILAFMTWGGHIYWFEGMILFIAYLMYFVIMYNNKRISEAVKNLVRKSSSTSDESEIDSKTAEADKTTQSSVYIIEESVQYYTESKVDEELTTDSKKTYKYYLYKLWCVIVWPLKTLLWLTVPNPKTRPKLFPLTFIICMIFIGMNSYMVSWMISIIGKALQVPDLVLGLTFMAAGGGLPEAVSIIIMSRKGNGRMGVSNALGANSMNILLSLGLPWFIKTLILSTDGVSQKYIVLESTSIGYIIIGLILVVVSLFLILYFNKFRLSRRTGIVLLLSYVVSVSLAITLELILPRIVTS